MTNSPISYDILTLVIDQLAAERRFNELNACSQTCRILLHPCRVHLFSTIRIGKKAPRFVTLLKENSTIPQYIQELTYRIHVDMSEDLANAFLLLNNIKTLNLYGHNYDCDWRSLSPHIQHAIAHLFSSPSMKRFYVHNIHHLPGTVLSSCSTLKHLTMSECHISSSVACGNILGAPPQLLSLDLSKDYLSGSDITMEELPKMKRASGLHILDFSTLRSLTVCVYNIQQEKHFENLLRLTPKLEYIQCSVFQGATPDSWVQKLAIVLPTLRSLKLKWDTYEMPSNIPFPALIKIIKMLTFRPNRINELFLILLTKRSFDSDVLLDLDWEVLDQVLADRSGFPQLEKLTIHLCSRHRRDLDNLKAGIEAGFEKTKATKFSRLFLAANDYLDFKFEVHD